MRRILISLLGKGATWSGDADETPCDVFITENGASVLSGGPYPDESESSVKVLEDSTLQTAEIVGHVLEMSLKHLNFQCQLEILGDG